MRMTYIAKPGKVERKWYVIDVKNVPMSCLVSTVASVLRGKNKPTFTPHVDTSDYVIVINAAQVKLTGRRASQKMYYRRLNYPGGLKQRTTSDLLAKEPEKLLETAIKDMLPHNSLGHKQGLKLHVYAGGNHRHTIQDPEVLDIINLI